MTIEPPQGSAGGTNPFGAEIDEGELAAALGGAIAFKDRSNTFQDFDQLFRSSRIKIRNPANIFSNILVMSAISAEARKI